MGSSPRLAADRDLTLADEAATMALAADVARLARSGDTIALWGDLGSGKTVFARGFIRALTDETEVPSPTFSLVQTYDAPEFTVSHFDFYRLDDRWEILELGFNDALIDGVALIEWPERLGDLLPDDRLDVRLRLEKDGRHLARLEPHGDWVARLATDAP
jgi:tRNA threonylcarbamoyladenosine biosynthesis protein TsaE